MIRKLRIVHLEDLPSDAALIGQVLKRAHLEFDRLIVDSKDTYIQALETFSPDIILSDHSLPSFNSFEALEILKKSKLNIPFILITAAMSDEFAVDVLKKGADDYIIKDRLERLPAAIQSILDKYQFGKEREIYFNELIANEHKYRSLIENSGDVVVILDATFKPTYVSPSIRHVLGYSEADALQLNLAEITPPEDQEAVFIKMTECLSKPGIPIVGQIGRVKHKDGSWRWTEATLTNMLHEPAINGIIDNFRDVTERVLTENALKDSEEKYRSFFENSLDGILLTAQDGRIFAANPAACRIFQWSEEEICQGGRALVIDTSDPRLTKALEERKLTGNVKAEITMLRKGGIKFPAEITSAVFLNIAGNERTSMIIRDITKRKKAEEELKESEEKYKQLFQANPLPIWIYAIDTLKILDINQAAIDHYGYSREEYLQLTLLDLRPPEEREKVLKLFKEQDLTVKAGNFGSYKHLKKDKTVITVEVSSYPISDNRRISVCNDITEKENFIQKIKENETKLLTAQHIARLGYWELNLKDHSIFWTDEVYKIWEVNPDSYKPTLDNLISSIHPDDKQQFIQEQSKASAGLKDLEQEHRILLPNGKIKWVYEKGKLIKDSQGNPLTFEGTVQDITEQKQAHETLLISEARHRGLVQSQTNYVIRTNLEGKYTYCNEKFLKDFAWIYPDGAIIGKDSMLSIKEYHFQRVMEVGEKCVTNPNTVFQVEIDKPLQNGEVKTTLWDFICLTNAKGEPTEVQCVGIDITDRIKAELELKESNTRYKLVSKATSDAIWDWDFTSGNFYWGEGFQTLFGYQLNTLAPDISAWTDHLHPEDAARINESVESIINSSESNWEGEYRYEKANGEYAYVIDRGFVIRDENNNAIRMVGAMQDITEKKKLQELLNKASQLARMGTFEADLIHNTLYWSDITKEIHEVDNNFTPNISQAINFYKEGYSRELISNAIKQAIEENTPFDLELQIVTAKGNERWVRAIGETECKDNVCTRFYGSFQDIDLIKRAEIELQKAFDERNTILESIGDAFFALDKNWIVNYWNKEAEKLLNTPKQNIIGKSLWDVFPLAVNSASYLHYQKAVTENSIQHFEDYYEPVNCWFEVTAYPSVNGLSVYFKDVTERKNADLQLVQLNENLRNYTEELVLANKGLEQFSYIVSHNLRAPVANIIGLANLMNYASPSDAGFREEILSGLLTSVNRLDTVIIDLNTILQVKRGSSEKKSIVSLPVLVSNIQESIELLIQKEKVLIKTDFTAFSELNTIKSYLHSIFYNLITNSIKYCRQNCPPLISINTEKQGGKLIIKFSDNGTGIDLTKKGDQVFGLYKRFHSNIEGKGLGLFMVKTQVESLGGKIFISSEVNKGTQFIIEFPDTELN